MIELTPDSIKQYRNLDEAIRDKCIEIVEIFDQKLDHDEVEGFEIYDSISEIQISVDASCCNQYQCVSYTHPLDYLFKSTEQLKQLKREMDEEREKQERVDKRRRAALAKARRKQEYLKLKKEFEGTTESPEKTTVKEAVYLCEYWEHDDDDPSGCGETWQWCHSEKSGRRECGCKRTYAMQFCPFYKKGKLAGKWVINDADKQAAEKFKKEFESGKIK